MANRGSRVNRGSSRTIVAQPVLTKKLLNLNCRWSERYIYLRISILTVKAVEAVNAVNDLNDPVLPLSVSFRSVYISNKIRLQWG